MIASVNLCSKTFPEHPVGKMCSVLESSAEKAFLPLQRAAAQGAGGAEQLPHLRPMNRKWARGCLCEAGCLLQLHTGVAHTAATNEIVYSPLK